MTVWKPRPTFVMANMTNHPNSFGHIIIVNQIQVNQTKKKSINPDIHVETEGKMYSNLTPTPTQRDMNSKSF